ncbi:alpha/beta fold hydrolase [Streptomyces sp. SD15]
MVDRRGHGPSGDAPGDFSSDFEVDTEDVLGLLEEAGGAHVVGDSCGGVVALLAAGRRPDLVASLVVIEHGGLKVAEDAPLVAEAVGATVMADLTAAARQKSRFASTAVTSTARRRPRARACGTQSSGAAGRPARDGRTGA